MTLSLTITGLSPHVGDRLFSAYDVGHWKPHPGLFQHAARAMGIPNNACAVVEDSPAGITAGLAAGMRVFALGTACGELAEDPRVTHITSLSTFLAHL